MNNIKIDYTNAMADAVGAKHGVSEAELDALAPQAEEAVRWLKELRENKTVGFFDLPSIDTAPFRKFASRIREKYENLVVLGIGGSALGTNAVHSALNPATWNLQNKRKRNGYPKLFVPDNIDPDWFHEILGHVDPKKTLFNVISKSGSTAETMSQFMIVHQLLKERLKGKWKKKVILTTDVEKGVLREIAEEFGLKAFDVPDNVGGRFSLFTAVGLVPLACVGVDIDSLLAGAAEMAERCLNGNLRENPALLFAALHYLADTEKKKAISVMMPYSSKLAGVADWYRQLWAESLGKRCDQNGKEVNTGQTPVKALGVTDQHSQVQLYVEGPFDKLVTFIEVENFRRESVIPAVFTEKPALQYLAGKSLNQLITTEMKGTEYALTIHNRPNLTIRLPRLDAHTLGQLLFLLETATAFSGRFYGIDPFDQPGVEFGKKYTYAMMGRDGYERMKDELLESAGAEKRKTV